MTKLSTSGMLLAGFLAVSHTSAVAQQTPSSPPDTSIPNDTDVVVAPSNDLGRQFLESQDRIVTLEDGTVFIPSGTDFAGKCSEGNTQLEVLNSSKPGFEMGIYIRCPEGEFIETPSAENDDGSSASSFEQLSLPVF